MDATAASLVASVVPLASHMARRFSKARGLENEDLAQAGLEALCRGMHQYRPDGGKFSSWAGAVMANGMMNENKRMRWQRFGTPREDRHLSSLDAMVHQETGDPYEPEELAFEVDWEHRIWFEQVLSKLHKIDREILTLYVVEDFEVVDIAPIVGMTKQNVHKRIRELRPKFIEMGIVPPSYELDRREMMGESVTREHRKGTCRICNEQIVQIERGRERVYHLECKVSAA